MARPSNSDKIVTDHKLMCTRINLGWPVGHQVIGVAEFELGIDTELKDKPV